MAQDALEQIAELKNVVKKRAEPGHWKQKEEQFKVLIEKFSKEPKLEPTENDLSLFKEIANLYVTTGNGFYYKKLMELMNVFLSSAMNEAAQTYKDSIRIFELGWIHKYPFAKQIYRNIDTIRSNNFQEYREAREEHSYSVIKIMVEHAKSKGEKQGKQLSKEEIESAKSSAASFKNTIFRALREGSVYHSKPLPKDILESNSYYQEYPLLTKSFSEALDTSYEEQRKVLEEDLKKELDSSKEKFRVACHNYAYSKGLSSLMEFYQLGDFNYLRIAPHLGYYSGAGTDNRFYPDTARGEVLIDATLTRLFDAKLNKSKAEQTTLEENEKKEKTATEQALAVKKDTLETNPKPLKVPTYSEELTAQFPDLKSWKMSPKLAGKDVGFILKSPDGKRKIYSKVTQSHVQYFYVANMLSHLGIKSAEPMLTDRLVSTHDLSRSYVKKESKIQKDKTFKTMLELIPSSNIAAWGTNPGEISGASTKEKEELKEFLDTFSADEKARISLAKLLIVVEAFNLGDVFSHGGNIGLIKTRKDNKTYIKFGIVDFTTSSVPLTGNESSKYSTIIDYLEREGKRAVYTELFKKLKPEDFRHAALELQNPKLRHTSDEGYRVVTGVTGMPLPSATAKAPQMPKPTQNLHDFLQQASKETIKTIQKTFKGKVNEDEVASDVKNIEANHPIIEENLNMMINEILNQTEKPKPK